MTLTLDGRRASLAGALARVAAAVTLAVAVATLATAPAVAHAAERVPAGATCSLTVQKCPAEGQAFHLYRVASMQADGSLVAVEALSQAVADTGKDPASLGKKTDAQELAAAAASYAGYVAADPAAFQKADAAASGGTVRFGELEPGMYLLVADATVSGGNTYTARPNLVIVPRLDGWTYQTDCAVDAKFEVTPARTYHNRVTKLWRGDSASARPASVTVAIYNGTKLYKQVKLDAINGWTYAWDGEGSWSVRELGVPAGYTCSLNQAQATPTSSNAGVNFQLTNSKPTTPGGGGGRSHSGGSGSKGGSAVTKTGDPNNAALPAALMCAGAVLALAGLWARRREDAR